MEEGKEIKEKKEGGDNIFIIVLVAFFLITLLGLFANLQIFSGITGKAVVEYPKELIAYYKLDGDGGDATQQRYNATIHDAKLVEGVLGQAYELDGLNDYIQIINSAVYDSEKGTWSLWIKTNQTYPPANEVKILSTIMERVSPSYKEGIGIYLTDRGTIAARAYDSYGRELFTLYSEANVLGDSWHQVALVFNRNEDGENKLYVDGIEEKSAKSSLRWDFSSQDIMVGKSIGVWWEKFKGAVDEVRIYNKNLSSEEIKKIYDELSVKGKEYPAPSNESTVEETTQAKEPAGEITTVKETGEAEKIKEAAKRNIIYLVVILIVLAFAIFFVLRSRKLILKKLCKAEQEISRIKQDRKIKK